MSDCMASNSVFRARLSGGCGSLPRHVREIAKQESHHIGLGQQGHGIELVRPGLFQHSPGLVHLVQVSVGDSEVDVVAYIGGIKLQRALCLHQRLVVLADRVVQRIQVDVRPLLARIRLPEQQICGDRLVHIAGDQVVVVTGDVQPFPLAGLIAKLEKLCWHSPPQVRAR